MFPTSNGAPQLLLVFYASCLLLSLPLDLDAPRHVAGAPSSISFSFDFTNKTSYNPRDLRFEGNTTVNGGLVDLTCNFVEAAKLRNCIGRMSYGRPVPFYDNNTGVVASFATRFTFNIKFLPGHKKGDGMAFFLVGYPSKLPQGSHGGAFGLLYGRTRKAVGENRFVAVEFDTYNNSKFDPQETKDHIGIDLSSVIDSVNTTSLPNFSLNGTMTAFINFTSTTGMLLARLHFDDHPSMQPAEVSAHLPNPTMLLPAEVAVGISAATGRGVELHQILSWSFDSTLVPKEPKSRGFVVGLAIVGGISLICLAPGIIFVMRMFRSLQAKRLRTKFFELNRGLLLQQLVDKDIAERMIFSLEELEKATNKFDESRKIGGGGHGIVYKGILSNKDVVAIKKSKITIQREIEDFINEVAILSQINHRYVVRLFGCCLETQVPLLVYEFISNGTLSDYLHVEGPRSLSWRHRLRIALETASALAYLHSFALTSIIHRDVKSANILLGHRLIAKVSDFGASRGIAIDQTGVNTASQGTFGYLDPEYYQTSRLTDKRDVYSFGVILVELLTRKKPYSFMDSDDLSLIAQFNLVLSQGKLCEILDLQIISECLEGAKEVAALASTCLNLKGEERPTMRQVKMTLERLLMANENTEEGYLDELNCTSARISNDNDNNSRHHSAERELILSASFPR